MGKVTEGGKKDKAESFAASAPQQGPLPAVVVQQAIMQQVAATHETNVPPLRVEVETRQGYVYEGKLVSLDNDYNVSLVEATLWRDRLCDIERALLSAKGFPAPAASPVTRRRYVGSVFIRSSSLLLVRFLQGEKSQTNDGEKNGCGTFRLKSAFKSMAIKVKRERDMERQKNRVERRKRLQLAAKAKPLAVTQTGAGVSSGEERKFRAKGTRKGRK